MKLPELSKFGERISPGSYTGWGWVLHITVRSDQVSLVQASEVSGWFVLQGVTQHIQDTNFVTSLLLSNVMLSSHILK